MATVTLVNGTTTHAFDFVGDYMLPAVRIRAYPVRLPS